VLSYFTKLVARFRSKEGYTVFLRVWITFLEGNYQHFSLILILTHQIKTRQRSWGQEEASSRRKPLSLISKQWWTSRKALLTQINMTTKVKKCKWIISIQNGKSSCLSRLRRTTCRLAIKVTAVPFGPKERPVHRRRNCAAVHYQDWWHYLQLQFEEN